MKLIEMSEYFRALCPVVKSRYSEKLSLLGLEKRDDPYATSNVDKFIRACVPFSTILYKPPNGRGTSVSYVYLPFNIPSHLTAGNSYTCISQMNYM